MNADNYDKFKDKAKELFEDNINTLPHCLLDLGFKTTMIEISYNIFAIKSTIGNILLSVLSNTDYINILLKEGFVNYNLNKGNFKITDFKNSYGINEDENDIIDIITRMKFEILDNNNKSIIYGDIACIYDKEIKDGDLVISVDENVFNTFSADYLGLDEAYFNSDNMAEKYDVIGKVSLLNKNGIELMHDLYEVIGDIYDYKDTYQRSVFIIDNKE